jgi:hypothetical protein
MATAPKMTIVVIMSAAPIEMAISSFIVDPSDCRPPAGLPGSVGFGCRFRDSDCRPRGGAVIDAA